jgi:hypothetical protein
MKIWLSKQFELEEWRRRMVFWGGAVATGAAAVLFAKGSDFAMALFFKARAWATWWPYVSAPVGLGLGVHSMSKVPFSKLGLRPSSRLAPASRARGDRGRATETCKLVRLDSLNY